MRQYFMLMENGKLVILEGSDGSGKKTQTQLLIDRLPARSTVKFSFPNYNLPTGKIITKYLMGEFGPTSAILPKIASTWYALNRHAHKDDIINNLEHGRHVVCDRYVESNMGHQGGKINDLAARSEFFQWCEDLEYGDFGMPRPNIGIFLHVPWQISKKLVIARGNQIDGHEADDNHLKGAENSYLQLATIYKWSVVECAVNGELRPARDISDEIFKVVEQQL